jgi:RNA polymerase sigma factor (sigma-70 family)
VDPSLDRALVLRIRKGDEAAFAEAYEAYRRRLLNFLLRMTRRPAVAEELLQETWTRLARTAPRLAEDTELGAWLFTVARNLARDHARSSRAEPKEAAMAELDVPDADESPEGWARASETQRRLSAGLDALPPGEREVILLVCIEGMAQDAVARLLDIGHDALRQRLTRARAKLMLLLESETPSIAKRPKTEEEYDHARH